MGPLKILDLRAREIDPKIQPGNPLGTQRSKSEYNNKQCHLYAPKTLRTADLTSWKNQSQKHQKVGVSVSIAAVPRTRATVSGTKKSLEQSQASQKVCTR
jgi:hypothetical protein